MPTSAVPSAAMKIAFNEIVAGVFTVDGSALDGTDGLSDVGLYAGSFDDVSADVYGDVTIETGTDALAATVQASSMTFTVSRPDDPSYWNPNNPASPLNSVSPGFTAMRPVRYEETQDATTYGMFTGFLRRATWRSDSRSCEIYCEDLLLRASRVYPTIASTGATTTGAVIDLLWDAVGYIGDRETDTGDSLADFSADGTQSVTQILAALLEAERGAVYVNGDGVPVYNDRYTLQARQPAATLTVTDTAVTVESGVDLDSIYTRATVNGATASDTDAEVRKGLGRADLPEITNDYVPAGSEQALADDLVYAGVNGKPPVVVTVVNFDADTLALMLTSPLLSVLTLADTFGGTVGDGVAQRIVHTVAPPVHQAEYTLTVRLGETLLVDGGAIDGPAALRY